MNSPAPASSAPVAQPIAIVGLSALFPGSVHKQAFWRNIVGGRDFIRDVPPDHFLVEDYFDPDPTKPGKIYVKRGAFLPAVPFSPLEFGIPPKNLPSTDSVQLLALLGAKQLLAETKSFQAGTAPRERTSVFLGVAAGTELIGEMSAKIQRPHWVEALRREGVPEDQVDRICQRIFDSYPDWTESTFPGLLANVTAGRIANRFDLGGANCVIDAACASSLAAITMGVDELRLGKTDLVITGGADALNDIFMFTCFTRTPAMSFTGDCRPFAEDADGTMMGEGLGLFALRRLADAERDGDAIYAVIRGIGSSSDGSSKSVYAPRAEGQAKAITRALAEAGCRGEDIELVEAHGTATKAGDAAEFGGLRAAFGESSTRGTGWCALGSIKSQIGHTKSAAGAAGLFKAVLALRQGVLPPTIKVKRPSPTLEIAGSPFYLNTQARPWVHAPDRPRRAGLSSFGFGGSNYHLTLEEYCGAHPAKRIAQDTTAVVLAAAETRSGLIARLEALAAQPVEVPLATIARRSWSEFSPKARHRAAVIAVDRASLTAHAEKLAQTLAASSAATVRLKQVGHYAEGVADVGPIAFLFPGQGSQYVNMGAELAMEFEAARSVWDRFATTGDTPLHRIVFPTPAFDDVAREQQETTLRQTEHAQPAIGVTALAQLALLDQVGLNPDFVTGHSYGELIALHAAGVIPKIADVVALSRRRGELMGEAARATPGAMTAVSAAAGEVEPYLSADVVVANYNSPRQCVVSGSVEAITVFEQRLTAAGGLPFKRLPVATAFHSSIVAPLVKPFAAELAQTTLAKPRVPVFANLTAAPYPKKPDEQRDLLARQLAAPVRFQQSIEALHAAGARTFIEVGPGHVLTRLTGHILKDRPHLALAVDAYRGHGVTGLLELCAQLAVAGAAIDFSALYRDFEDEQPDPTVGPQARGVVMINGTNVGKPYPPANGAAGRTPPVVKAAASPAPASPAPSPPPVRVSAPVPARAAVPATPLSVSAMSTNNPFSPAPSDHLQRLALLEQIQRNMLDAQRHFESTLAQSHLAFLHTSETMIRQIGGGVGPVSNNGVSNGNHASHAGNGHAPVAAPTIVARPLVTPVAAPSVVSRPVVMAPPPVAVAPRYAAPVAAAPVVARVHALAPVAVPAAAAVAVAVAPAAKADVQEIIISTIATSTGYPAEMIELDVELEAGLGIDSIKKVEIFSALQAQVPAFAGVDTGMLAALTTPRKILAFTQQLTGAGGEPEKN